MKDYFLLIMLQASIFNLESNFHNHHSLETVWDFGTGLSKKNTKRPLAKTILWNQGLFWSRSFSTFDFILCWVPPSLQSLKVSSFGNSYLDLWPIFQSLGPVCLLAFLLHAYWPNFPSAKNWVFPQLISPSPFSLLLTLSHCNPALLAAAFAYWYLCLN